MERCDCSSNANQLMRELLQMESFPHQPLQSRLVENVVGEFFIRKHGEGSALGPGGQF